MPGDKDKDKENADEENFFDDEDTESIEEMEELDEAQMEEAKKLAEELEISLEEEAFSAYTDHIKKCMGEGKTMKACAKEWKAKHAKKGAEGQDDKDKDKEYPYPKKCPKGQVWDEEAKKCVPEKGKKLTASHDAFDFEVDKEGINLYVKGDHKIKKETFSAEEDLEVYNLDSLVEGFEPEDEKTKALREKIEAQEKKMTEMEEKMSKLEHPKKKSENFSKGKGGKTDACFEEALVAARKAEKI